MQSRIRAILIGTLAVGVLDISQPILFWYFYKDIPPIRILQSVAAGLYGREAARAGGIKTALVGLALHFFIAFCVATIYNLASSRFTALVRHPWIYGPIYGLLVHAFMLFVVIPNSAIGAYPKFDNPIAVASGLFAHIFCVGIPAALSARLSARSA